MSVWEGRSANLDQDLIHFRWSFNSDGTYIASKRSDNGDWELLKYDNCTYKLVDNILITNWISVDYRDNLITICELWIVNIDGSLMEWTALRPFGKSVSRILERLK